MDGTGGTGFEHDNSSHAVNITQAIPRSAPRVIKISA